MILERLRTAQGLVCAGVLVVLALLGFEAARALRQEYRTELAGILARGERTAQKLAARTTEVFDRVNQTTLLAQYLGQQRALPPLASLRAAGVISDDLVQFMYIADARGFVTDTTGGLSALNVADEDFFKLHQRQADLDLHIAPAWVNPISGKHGIPVTRRLDAQGKFNGMIAVTIDPAALSLAYGKTEAPGTAVSVLGEDGIFRSRTIDGVHTFGERADPARVLAAAATARSHGNPHASPIDGKQRFLSVVKVDKYPLFAVVAADADIALAPYRQTRQQVLTWATVVGLITVLTGALLLTQANRLEASRRLTQETEAAFRATLEGSMDAVTLLRPMRDAAGALLDWTVVDCNSLAATLMGRKREQVLGQSVCELAPSIRSDGFLKFFEQVLNTQRRMHAEVPATEAHLVGQWLHHQLVPLENGVACITRDVTDKHLAESRLAALARHDALTSIFNRRHFQQTLHDGVARAARTGEPLALLYVDLDGFKAINDKHGHAAGDAVLVEVARRLKAVVRTTDTVGRLGGDEFAVLAENAGGEANIQELCARIVGALRAPHVLSATHSTFATPSVGLAIFDGAESAQALCERADAAMYRAKSAGKSRWETAEVRAQVGAVVGASEGSARSTQAAVLI